MIFTKVFETKKKDDKYWDSQHEAAVILAKSQYNKYWQQIRHFSSAAANTGTASTTNTKRTVSKQSQQTKRQKSMKNILKSLKSFVVHSQNKTWKYCLIITYEMSFII